MQQYADIYLLLNYSTCFGRPSRPSVGVHKTVVAASGTDHTIWRDSFLKRDLWSHLRKLAPQIVRSVPEAATTVLCRYLFTAITLHVSGVHRAHHQEYIKLYLQSLVQIILNGSQLPQT